MNKNKKCKSRLTKQNDKICQNEFVSLWKHYKMTETVNLLCWSMVTKQNDKMCRSVLLAEGNMPFRAVFPLIIRIDCLTPLAYVHQLHFTSLYIFIYTPYI